MNGEDKKKTAIISNILRFSASQKVRRCGVRLFRISSASLVPRITRPRVITHYSEGAELIDSVLDVVRKEVENYDCLQVCF